MFYWMGRALSALMGQATGPYGPGPDGPPWALMGRALVGAALMAPPGPLWAPLGPYGSGPCGPPWATDARPGGGVGGPAFQGVHLQGRVSSCSEPAASGPEPVPRAPAHEQKTLYTSFSFSETALSFFEPSQGLADTEYKDALETWQSKLLTWRWGSVVEFIGLHVQSRGPSVQSRGSFWVSLVHPFWAQT